MAMRAGGKKVMIFGVFDGLHKGHQFFVSSALSLCAESDLVIIVTRDSIVRELKHKSPLHTEMERIELLKQTYPRAQVMLGDEKLGVYEVIRMHHPVRVFLGYDQDQLRRDLERAMREKIIDGLELITGSPHLPEQYSSTRLASG